MSKITIFLLAFVFSLSAMFAEGGNEKIVNILTNAHCGSCKSSIEKQLNKQAGVLGSKLNLDNKIVEVRYNADKTNPAKLTKSLTDIKYTAEVVTLGNESQKTDEVKEIKAKSAKGCGMECRSAKSSKSCCPSGKK